MADATQVQIRRDTAANLAATTPVEAELGYDQTNKRILIGDGSTLAGIPHVSFNDQRTGFFRRGTVGGTGDAITLTLSPSISSYQTNLELDFIPSGTNTGPVTIDVDGVGVRNIYKMSNGTLVSLDAGDLVLGAFYKIKYDGVQFQVFGLGGGIGSISQGNLNTATGTFSQTVSSNTAFTVFPSFEILAPGGEYGFHPQARSNGGLNLGWLISNSTGSAVYTTRLTPWSMNYSGSLLIGGQQRYVDSSPPYDLGDGEVSGFVFLLVNQSNQIVSHYAAESPPWAHNGPTKITATHKCPVTGKKFRNFAKKRSFEEIMDGAEIKYEYKEITNAIKNKDMKLIPHPFGGIPQGYKVVMVDPMDDKIRKIMEYQNSGGIDWTDALFNGKIEIGDECQRCGPKGVHIHKLKYKYTKRF